MEKGSRNLPLDADDPQPAQTLGEKTTRERTRVGGGRKDEPAVKKGGESMEALRMDFWSSFGLYLLETPPLSNKACVAKVRLDKSPQVESRHLETLWNVHSCDLEASKTVKSWFKGLSA